MSDVAIEMDALWKKFHRGERHDSLRDLIPAAARRVMKGAQPAGELGKDDFWALGDVTFQVQRGDALGIIGHNGAGKSTLLKILTRLLRPTLGTYATHGRIGALIEVTAGFHPDLTGRENIYLNGSIIGMKKADIARRFDAIVEFSGIGEFIDTPVKRYSSGMNARLGFSVAAHLEPEILIVDEVLSVGDYTFQGKCIRWMQNLLASGTTVIFVSHNMDSVLSLCNSALLLDQGRVAAKGDLKKVIGEYYKSGGRYRPELLPEPKAQTVEFKGPSGGDLVVGPGERVTFLHTVKALADVELGPGFFVSRGEKTVVDTTYARMRGHPLRLKAGDTVQIEWSLAFNLPAGVYEVGYHIGNIAGGYHEYQSRACIVTVGDDPRVKGDSFVALRLEAHRTEHQALHVTASGAGVVP
jgi:ABC-type polysaccharide/polyol phosphate transport system ATPase subunit